MKKTIFFSFAILGIALFFFSDRILLRFMQNQLTCLFPGSSVVIKHCTLNPFHSVILNGIEIKNEKVLKIDIQELEFYFRWPDLFRKRLEKVSIHHASLELQNTRMSMRDSKRFIRLDHGNGLLDIQELNLSDGKILIETNSFEMELKLFIDIKIAQSKIETIKAKLTQLKLKNFLIRGGHLSIERNEDSGSIEIRKIKIGKARIEGISGRVFQKGKDMAMDVESLNFFEGRIRAIISLIHKNILRYSLKVKMDAMNTEKIIHDLDMSDKVNMKGFLEGEVDLEGSSLGLTTLEGLFHAIAPGGVLTIKDRAFLESIAKNINQPVEFIEKSFEEYRYTQGEAQMQLRESDFIASFQLQGPGGKRNIAVVFHDFKKRSEGI